MLEQRVNGQIPACVAERPAKKAPGLLGQQGAVPEVQQLVKVAAVGVLDQPQEQAGVDAATMVRAAQLLLKVFPPPPVPKATIPKAPRPGQQHDPADQESPRIAGALIHLHAGRELKAMEGEGQDWVLEPAHCKRPLMSCLCESAGQYRVCDKLCGLAWSVQGCTHGAQVCKLGAFNLQHAVPAGVFVCSLYAIEHLPVWRCRRCT